MKWITLWYHQRTRTNTSSGSAVIGSAGDHLQEVLGQRWWLWRKYFLEAKRIAVEQRIGKRMNIDSADLNHIDQANSYNAQPMVEHGHLGSHD